MRKTIRYSYFLVPCLLLLPACSESEDEGGGSSSSITPINSSASARNAARDIVAVCLQARAALSNGSYVDQGLTGNSGTATLTGVVSFQSGISCGASCVRSENNTSFVIVFNNLVVNTASNTKTTVSGSINYSDSTFSQQSDLNFSSGGAISISNNTNISYELIGTDVAGTFGTRDTITFVNSSGSSQSSQQGSVSTAAGTFAF